jgi:hypothetical protein
MHLQPDHAMMSCDYSVADENGTIVSKDWTHLNLSVNSEEINKMPSPFDDIGYLATENAPSRSINMKGSVTPWDDSDSNHQRVAKTNNNNNNKSIGSGPSLNDFLQKEKQSISQQQQMKDAVNDDIRSRGASRLPFRRGKLLNGVSRRGDIGNNSSHQRTVDDDESIGISTIASRATAKFGSKAFEFSKGSLTLSMLGASKSKHKYNDSKSRGTKTTEASTHTKSTFGSSMFSRDTSKSKVKLREMIDQLESANNALVTENHASKAALEELIVAYNRAILFEQWFSVQENAEMQTELSKAQCENARTKLENKDLKTQIKAIQESMKQLEKEAIDQQSVNDAQADRIAFLEAKLLENQLDPSHHHQLVKCENPVTISQDSLASFGSFGSLDDIDDIEHEQSSYEAELNCKDSAEEESIHSSKMSSKAFNLILDDQDVFLAKPPPPPPRRCMTDPCNSHRKKTTVEKPLSSRSKSTGFRKNFKELSAASATGASTDSSKNCGTVISTSRVSDKPRRSRSTSTGARATVTPREPRASDSTRTRRSQSAGKISRETSDQKDASKSVPTTPSRQASRRRLKKADSLDGSQHSAKSNKSCKSLKSAKSSGTIRRRAIAKPLDPLGAGSTHSTKSAARRRLRNCAIAEMDRSAVKEALNRFAGQENDPHKLEEEKSTAIEPLKPLLQPPPSDKATPALRRAVSTVSKRPKTMDFKDLVSCKPMVLVQDNAKTQQRTQSSTRQVELKKWAPSA